MPSSTDLRPAATVGELSRPRVRDVRRNARQAQPEQRFRSGGRATSGRRRAGASPRPSPSRCSLGTKNHAHWRRSRCSLLAEVQDTRNPGGRGWYPRLSTGATLPTSTSESKNVVFGVARMEGVVAVLLDHGSFARDHVEELVLLLFLLLLLLLLLVPVPLRGPRPRLERLEAGAELGKAARFGDAQPLGGAVVLRRCLGVRYRRRLVFSNDHLGSRNRVVGVGEPGLAPNSYLTQVKR